MSLRTVLVGAASRVAGPCHRIALARCAKVNVVGYCDTDVSLLAAVGAEDGVTKLFRDYDEVLADDTVDAVDIIVPPFLHKELTIKAAEAGKHVYVEKPMARSLGECRSMIRASADAGKRLMVGESYFFSGPHVLARKLIDEGEIGTVQQVRINKAPWVFTPEEDERLDGGGHDPPWRFDPVLSGGGDYPFMFDHACHLFATARLFGGCGVSEVFAMSRDNGLVTTIGDESMRKGITSLSWVYEGGASDGSWNQYEWSAAQANPGNGPYHGFHTYITGTEGTLLVFGEGGGSAVGDDQPPPVILVERHFDPEEGGDRCWASNNSYYDSSHTNALNHWADCCLDPGLEMKYGAEGQLHDINATLAVIKSAYEGRKIALSEITDDWTAYNNHDDEAKA